MKQPSSAPPELRGFEFVRWLGGGGFADVFLFRQRRPNREVAIKVLRQSVFDPAVQEQFEAEADLMAAVSGHPFIVSIYSADIAPDGRPYLVMEYYPKGHYLDRARRGSVSIDEAIRVGIQVASAVETAHEAGIFHNDIKPSNVLLSGFDRPGLTDFGISVAAVDGSVASARGASLPYTAPEIVEDETSGSRPSDVFALAATVYAMLSGHSPFERPNGANSAADVLDRVLHLDSPPLRRDGVPASLENLLRRSLSRRANQRPQTARSFATSLQAIEQELGFQMTALELRTEVTQAVDAPSKTDQDSTRYRGPVVVRPEEVVPPPPPVAASPVVLPPPAAGSYVAPPEFHTAGARTPVDDVADLTHLRHPPVAAPPVEATERRESNAAPTTMAPPASEAPSISRRARIAAGVIVAVIAVGAVAVLMRGNGSKPPDDGGGPKTTVTLGAPLFAPSDVVVKFVADGVVEATWKAPDGSPVTGYEVTRVDAAANGQTTSVTEPKITFKGLGARDTPCIEVSSRRDNRISQSHTASLCASK